MNYGHGSMNIVAIKAELRKRGGKTSGFFLGKLMFPFFFEQKGPAQHCGVLDIFNELVIINLFSPPQ